MSTRFENLICSSETARYFLSICVDERGAVAGFFYDWQTLITGLLAVLAATVSGILLWKQIQDQRAQSDKAEQQKVRAVLIQVPHALAEINEYLVTCFDAWKRKKPDDRPRPPSAALKVIMDAAAYVDDASFKSMQQLIIKAQTFESRLASPGRQRPHNVLDIMIADIAELSYLTIRLFKFGRMDEDAPSIPYVKPTRADCEIILARDFDLKLLPESDPIIKRVDQALRMRFPSVNEGD